MKKFKTVIALLLVAVMAIGALSACGGGGGNSSGGGGADAGSAAQEADVPSGDNAGRELNYGISGDAGTLYPFAAQAGFVTMMYAFYEPLWNFTADGERYFVLAEDWEMVDDTHYILTMRDDVTFSNGNPMTASDVLFSMQLCAEDPRFYLNVKAVDMERTQVTGDYTLDVYYTDFNSTQDVSFSSLFVLDEESYDLEYLANHTIGTGPYVCTEYVNNSHVTAVARDDYWGDQPQIQQINFKVINEPSQYINELETGGLDIASSIPFAEMDYVSELGYNVTSNFGKYSITALYSFNGPLANQDARYAVSYAINRNDVAQIMFGGTSEPCTYATSNYQTDYEPRFSEISEMYDLNMSQEDRVALAQQYAESGGLVGQTLKLITNGAEDYNNAATVIQDNLSAIGVNVEIVPLDSATYFATVMDETNFDIALFYLVAPSYQIADVCGNYMDFVPLGWSGPQRDEAYENFQTALRLVDPAERSDYIYHGLEVFQEVCPWYAMCEAVSPMAVSADLGGAVYGLNGYVYQHLYWQ